MLDVFSNKSSSRLRAQAPWSRRSWRRSVPSNSHSDSLPSSTLQEKRTRYTLLLLRRQDRVPVACEHHVLLQSYLASEDIVFQHLISSFSFMSLHPPLPINGYHARNGGPMGRDGDWYRHSDSGSPSLCTTIINFSKSKAHLSLWLLPKK